eukprot:NODE_1436_length_1141_cov_369.690608.p1 GENE.NODE_1436_length_1141_cov_369.690608~~NODE_1436_length_1141_cov_369.690608.p1  ORF type:complete len:318 (-),score=76.95 NODE_1436_length_1141_cov_369.690608:99-1052(-)
MAAAAPPIPFETRTFGDPKNPAMVIVVGTGASMNNGLIEKQLEERGFFVITYNQRDVIGGAMEKLWDGDKTEDDWNAEMGKAFDPAKPGFEAAYDWNDQADDFGRVLDQYGIEKAHVIGFSTGGTIAQIIMTRLPQRVLTAILGSSGFRMDGAPFESPEAAEFLKVMGEAPALSAEMTREDFVKRQVMILGHMMEFKGEADPRCEYLKTMAGEDFDKGWFDKAGVGNPRSALAYAKWLANGGEEARNAALEVNTVPSLILHGRNDPIVPFVNSEELHRHTKSSTFYPHEYGHILGPAPTQEVLLNVIEDFAKTRTMK